MTETELEKMERNAKFMAQHELTEDQLERLIENKLIRAREYYEALQKREILLEGR